MKYALLLAAALLQLGASSEAAEVRVILYYDSGIPVIHLSGFSLSVYPEGIGKPDSEPIQTVLLEESPTALFDLEPGEYRAVFDEAGFVHREMPITVYSRPQAVRTRISLANVANYDTVVFRDGRHYAGEELVRSLAGFCLLDGRVIQAGDKGSRLWLRAEPFLRKREIGSERFIVDNAPIDSDGRFASDSYVECGLYLFSVFQDNAEPNKPPTLVHSEPTIVGQEPIELSVVE